MQITYAKIKKGVSVCGRGVVKDLRAEKIKDQPGGQCFLENVSEFSSMYGIVKNTKRWLTKILKLYTSVKKIVVRGIKREFFKE